MKEIEFNEAIWKEGNKFSYELRRGKNILRGEIISAGKGFKSRSEAIKEINKELNKLK